MSAENVIYVQALYPFVGKNNDELCFKKGDVIIVTQKEDGGWWEGTFNNNTGWFPSNYVTVYDPSDADTGQHGVESPPLSPQQSQQQVVYRSMILKDLVDSERAHISELHTSCSNYLMPLQSAGIVNEMEFKQLTGQNHLDETINAHRTLLTALEEQIKLPSKEQKIGGTFLRLAPYLTDAHKAYICNHPVVVSVIEKHKDEINTFLEQLGAPNPGSLALTSLLSLPFRRLNKYPNVLLEVHRHMEEFHPDRGDSQRSIHVFKELGVTCSSIRRQKQLELDVVTHKIIGLNGQEPLSSFGEIVLMKSVALLPDHRDRYLVLFPNWLVVLALSARASSFIYEGKYALNSISVKMLQDTNQFKNAFEIISSSDNMIILCQSKSDQQLWVESLQHCIISDKTSLVSCPDSLQPVGSNLKISPSKPMTLTRLRPLPPLRPQLSVSDDKRCHMKTKKRDDTWNEDDALILKVIELYCMSSKARYTVNSSVVLRSTDNKLEKETIREINPMNETPSDMRVLLESVTSMKDQISSMSQNYEKLRHDFEKEKHLTQSLKMILERYLPKYPEGH